MDALTASALKRDREVKCGELLRARTPDLRLCLWYVKVALTVALLLLALIHRDASCPGFGLLAHCLASSLSLVHVLSRAVSSGRSGGGLTTETSGGCKRIFEAGLFVFFSHQSPSVPIPSAPAPPSSPPTPRPFHLLRVCLPKPHHLSPLENGALRHADTGGVCRHHGNPPFPIKGN